jgi:molybdate/tungstate transport system ATP-binding protein
MKIKLVNVTIFYENKPLLENLTAEFESGKFSVLLGSSGSGKTTILKIIAGISDDFKGKVLFNDNDVTSTPVTERYIGWVPQQQLLFPGMSVYDNIAYGLQSRGIDKETETKRVKEISNLVGVSHLLNRAPDRLSGGERQRVAIARALAPKPKLLLLDEPFSSLDAPERDRLALIMREVQMITGVTTIHVTHSPREAELLADQIFVLSSGKIIQSGTMNEIKNNPKTTQVASLIGLSNVVEDWEEMGSVIIPTSAILMDNEGEFEAEQITTIGDLMIVKIGEYRLEMLKPDFDVSPIFKVSIDSSQIISLNN